MKIIHGATVAAALVVTLIVAIVSGCSISGQVNGTAVWQGVETARGLAGNKATEGLWVETGNPQSQAEFFGDG